MTTDDRTCSRCGGAVPGQARFCPGCGSTVARLSPGQVLDGKYEILDKVAEGGMGEVYRARHIHLDEIRIIKVTKPGGIREGVEPRRFQEEARIATLVRHPNVAALYDFSRMPDGSYYMVWEFIDGVTLEDRLRRDGPLPLRSALAVAGQILAGLAEVHAQGIVHRDLSPDNIMLRQAPGGRLQAKIIDLGIAKRVASEPLAMTSTGLFLGKLKYCSPEQAGALPAGTALDGRSDLYSFGAVLYEMVAGKPPFESQTPEGYLGKHLHERARRIDSEKLPGAAGAALSAAVAKALEKKRENRFHDAREFADELARIDALAAAPPAPPAQRPGPPASSDDVPETIALHPAKPRAGRNRTLAAAAVAILAGIAGYLWSTRTPARLASGRAAAAVRRTATSPAVADVPTITPSTAAPATASAAEAVPAPAPAPSPAAPVSAAPAPAPSPAPPPPGPTPAEARTVLFRWKARPEDARARRAPDVARMADRFVATHPDDPLSGEIRGSLPDFLRTHAAEALDRAQPLNAVLYFRAYRQLSFAPPDADLQARIERLRR